MGVPEATAMLTEASAISLVFTLKSFGGVFQGLSPDPLGGGGSVLATPVDAFCQALWSGSVKLINDTLTWS